jgi:thiol-disulfide isomerase/thioredoxin
MHPLPETPVSSSWRRWSKILVLDLLVFLGVYFAVQWWTGRDRLSGIAPALQGISVDGRAISLQAYQGRPVLLHFWASWCRICQLQHGTIDNIAKDHAVITVMTRSGNQIEAMQYLRETGIRAAVILDEEGKLADSYRVRGVPASFIINAKGEVVDVEIGFSSEIGLRARLYLASW